MKFRPCIDLHQGKVKQIVGETMQADSAQVVENFVSELTPAHYAELYRRDELTGGHIIMLGGGNEQAATEALQAYPGGLQIGGGINADNAALWLERGAAHVIVTSYIFNDGTLQQDNLDRIVSEVGKERLVIDLSCKARNGEWVVVTNGWRTFSDFIVRPDAIKELEQYCSEFLIHAVDVEGKRSGYQEQLVSQLAEWTSIPTTYAGGVRSIEDLVSFQELSKGKLDVTIGSALDIFGGALAYQQVVEYCKNR